MTGGGAGYAGGGWYGFTAVHLTDDGGFTTHIDNNDLAGAPPVRFPQNQCSTQSFANVPNSNFLSRSVFGGVVTRNATKPYHA